MYELDRVSSKSNSPIWIHGARWAFGPRETRYTSAQITKGRISQILSRSPRLSTVGSGCIDIDLTGFLLMPGLINAHDHLQFALYPKLGNPPYRNYIEWGEDIHSNFSQIIAKHHSIPKDLRLWWGGIRNLLCGVTTVCHHNTLWPELQRSDFPVQVVQNYGWGHSFALDDDLRIAHATAPKDSVFIIHACEGVDDIAQKELFELDRLGFLDKNTILVHGLAIDAAGVSLIQKRKTSIILCPSSNKFLFDKLPDMANLRNIENLTLGNDSPLTAAGDLLDEIRFAIAYCGVSPDVSYRMVTKSPSTILRLNRGQGSICIGGAADLLGLRDTGLDAADRLHTLSAENIEFVMIAGHMQLASKKIYERLPCSQKIGMELLQIEETVRWLRAPVKNLLRRTEERLGEGQVKLGGRRIFLP
jgi:hypothetical protein